MPSEPLHSTPRGAIQPVRLLPPEEARTEGHPKLVALLVGEDYAPDPGRPQWGQLNPLPGIWQDLARLKRRLTFLGFGKIIVLGGGRDAGAQETIPLEAVPDVPEEPAGDETLAFDGPATRAAVMNAASQLRDHVYAHHTEDDGEGNEVPPLFVFYYSGHGFINDRGMHCLPLADNREGEQTGELIRTVAERVGAEDPSRGAAGGGSSLVFLDCCQAAGALEAGAKAGEARGGLLESEIMDAIRQRKGRFLVGASLGDERAKEGPGGGHFTAAVCASLSPERLGIGREAEATLSLNHLILSVDRMLLDRGAQAVSRFPPPGEVAWDNYVLFANPHHRPARETVRLYVTTVPDDVRVLGEEDGEFRELELLSGGFVADVDLSQEGRRVYRVPEDWRGKPLRLRAVPSGAEASLHYEPSPDVEVILEPDATGGPPIAALALREVRETGEATEDAAFARAQRFYEEARAQAEPLEQYRQYQAALELLEQTSHPFAASVIETVKQELEPVRSKAGDAQLERLIRLARSPASQDRYREAYDRLAELEMEPPELKEFLLSVKMVTERVRKARAELLNAWKEWAESRRIEAADYRMDQADQFLVGSQPWQAWRLAFEAESLVGADERTRGLVQRSEDQAVEGIFNSRISLDVLVSNAAHGILAELIQGEGPVVASLQRVLGERYELDSGSLREQMAQDRQRLRETHAEWFPPGEFRPVKRKRRGLRRKVLWAAAGMVLLGLVGWGGWLGWQELERRRTDDIIFGQAKSANTQESYRSYLTRYTDGLHLAEARAGLRGLDSLAYVSALEQHTRGAYDRYLLDWDAGTYADSARAAIIGLDNGAYDEAADLGTREAYKAYLKAWTDGGHIQEARAALEGLDDAAYRRAATRNTVSAYEDYLKEWPGGQHDADARSGIKQIKQRQAARRRAEDRKREEAAREQRQYEGHMTGAREATRGRDWAIAIAAYEAALRVRPGDAEAQKALGEVKSLQKVLAGMVYVAAGEFTMGSTQYDDEKPAHKVYLDGYYIDRTEVTNAAYAEFLNAKGNQAEGGVTWLEADSGDALIESRGGRFAPKAGYGEHPVIEVSWHGAKAYCEWAGKRLPTEAEWEKAARGTDGRTYPWGASWDAAKANAYGDGDGYSRTAPVGSFALGASPYGALDMSGNVWEWCSDWYDEDYYKSSPSRNPKGPSSGSARVLRGGSWSNDLSNNFRAACRDGGGPTYRVGLNGFRCARNE